MGRYIPNQHGAWAMLILPFLFGTFAAKPNALHALLFVCWLLVYLLMYPMLQWVRTGKAKRYRKPVMVYGALLIPFAAAALWAKPEMVWFGLPMAPLLLVNLYYARKNRERAMLNDIAAIIQFSLVIFLCYFVGNGQQWTIAAELFLVSVFYFIGTALYVKTMIREKHNPVFYWISVGYHVVLLAVLGIVLPKLLLLPLIILLVRAVWSPRTKLKVKQSGMLEIAYSCIMAIAVLAVF